MSDKNVLIQVKELKKAFGSNQVLDGITTDICQGEVVAIIGPSGSGKSTFLRSLNLLEVPTGGQILFEGTDITDPKVDINRHRQKIGMVFQQFNLFSNLTVKDNLLIAPIKTQKKNKDEMLQKAKEYLEVFGIADKLDAYPHQLSGGQKQRVAIVRALMLEPDLMLFDEPTSALDPEMIKEVLDAIRRLSQIGMTMVIVTHEMGFAREVASRVCFLEGAKIRVDTDSKTFFEDTEDERLKQFLSVILHH